MPTGPELICAVVVARNEEATVEVCLTAARGALDSVGGGEILLVDSASTDRTAAIGLQAGARVLAVRSASRICPSAMRYLGAAHTSSHYILFLDGDCELEPEFLRTALETMQRDASLGVIAGRRRDFYRTSQGLVPAKREYYSGPSVRVEVRPSYGGCALYRRKALEEAGSFDPFLRAKEEQDLAQRIMAAGYRIEVLPIPMIRHMTVPRESARRLLRSLNHGFFVGRGQAMRKFLVRGEVEAAFHGLEKVFLTWGHLALGVACVAAWLRGVAWPLAAWVGLSLAGLVAFAARSGGLARAVYYLAEWLVQGVCLGIGLLTPQRPASSFRWEGKEITSRDRAAQPLPGVLLVGPLPPPPLKGGVEKGVDMLLRGSLARRTAMRLFNTSRSFDPTRPFMHRVRFQCSMLLAFRSTLRLGGVDLVHVKTSSGINFLQNSLYALMARLAGLPVLLQIHSGRFETFFQGSSRPMRAWIRYTLSRARLVAVLSPSWAERVSALAPAARIRVVPNGLTLDEIARLSGGSRPRPCQVLFLGTGRADLNRDKGLDDLLAVLPDLWRSHPQCRWVLAGLSEPPATLKTLKASGVDPEGSIPRIRCLGLVDSESKEALLKESSILVLPSYFENMPNTLLEAMAAGLGVVATDVGAIPELLGAEGGAVIAPGDLQALSSSLGRLLASPPLVDAQGQRNQQVVRHLYNLEAVEADLEGLYREIDAGGRNSSGNVHATIHSASRPNPSPTAVSNGHPVARR